MGKEGVDEEGGGGWAGERKGVGGEGMELRV